jgi:phospholipase C
MSKKPEISRRTFLGAAAATALLAELPGNSKSNNATAAFGGSPAAGRCELDQIKHVIIWIQENRSFDHYFGTYPAVRGFSDPHALPGVFTQATNKTSSGSIQPFHLGAECLADPGHDWTAQHQAWADGALNQWGVAHEGDVDESFMGYYTRSDLKYYYGLADTWTLCDNYFCSVIGETTPNRMYAMTGMLDAEGLYGGPVMSTINISSAAPTSTRSQTGLFSPGWKTYPEALTEAGISWKVYGNPTGNPEYAVLPLFQQYYPQNFPPDSAEAQRAATLTANGLDPQFPADFMSDLANGTLPQVTWIIPPAEQSEHPAFGPQDGENLVDTVITALKASSAWPSTAMFITYDENGGFFDHVPPLVPPQGTPGEFPITEPTTPIGLGFRVPMLVISPFSKGGFVCRDRFDHTSLLRFLETRFGVRVPNLTAWRREHVGDLTSAFNFAARADASIPTIAGASVDSALNEPTECLAEEFSQAPNPTPAVTGVPRQEPGFRPSPSGLTFDDRFELRGSECIDERRTTNS